MKDNDIIQKFIFNNANIRGEIVRLTHSYQTIVGQHNYPESLRHLLGEMLVVSSLLTATLKFQGRLTIQFQGQNPLKLLLAQCNHHFQMRAVAQWQGNLSNSELVDALIKGILVININPDTTTTPYQGMVAWEGNSLTKSIEGYFKNSEQLPTRLWLAVNDTTAVGLLIQIMPQSEKEYAEHEHEWSHIQHLTETITPDELLNLDNQSILRRLYSQEDIRLFDPTAVEFRCTCSVERSENAILLLGQEEAEQELQAKQKIIVTCEFCNKEYIFDRIDITKLFKVGGGDASSTQIH